MSIMIMSRFPFVILFSAATALGVAAPAIAQPAAGEDIVTQELAPEAPPANETRDEKLDRLFAAMEAASADDQSKLALEIKGIWANSGSPSMDLLLGRALEATAAEAHAKARVHLNALTRLAPDFAEAWNASATLYFVQNDFGRAVDDISRALALEPRHFNALAGLGIILERVEKHNAALDAWRRVKALYPDFHGALEAIDRLEPIVRGKEL